MEIFISSVNTFLRTFPMICLSAAIYFYAIPELATRHPREMLQKYTCLYDCTLASVSDSAKFATLRQNSGRKALNLLGNGNYMEQHG